MTNNSISMVGAEYFPPVLARQMIFIYVHPHYNGMFEIMWFFLFLSLFSTHHSSFIIHHSPQAQAPLHASLQFNLPIGKFGNPGVVRDHNNRFTVLGAQSLQNLDNVIRCGRIKISGGLVG